MSMIILRVRKDYVLDAPEQKPAQRGSVVHVSICCLHWFFCTDVNSNFYLLIFSWYYLINRAAKALISLNYHIVQIHTVGQAFFLISSQRLPLWCQMHLILKWAQENSFDIRILLLSSFKLNVLILLRVHSTAIFLREYVARLTFLAWIFFLMTLKKCIKRCKVVTLNAPYCAHFQQKQTRTFQFL